MRFLVLLSNCILFPFILVFSSNAQECRALFVGISQYPSESGWENIHGAEDYKLLLPMLKRQGYSEEKITVLLNEKAIKSTIVSELKKLAKVSQKGDFVYIHFSTHGQQMEDDNEDEEDNLDEAIIPYDAKRRYLKGKYEGENHIRDDELEILLENIRRKIGSKGNIIVLLDACHSGTANREITDDIYVRGTPYIFSTEEKDVSKKSQSPSLQLKKSDYLSPITVFSACQPDEINYEYRNEKREYYGTLSFAFCRLMTTYLDILSNDQFAKKLKIEMDKLFQGKKNKQTPYFETTNEKGFFKIGNRN